MLQKDQTMGTIDEQGGNGSPRAATAPRVAGLRPPWSAAATRCHLARVRQRVPVMCIRVVARAEAGRSYGADVGARCQDGVVASESRMVALGFGKFARADRIYALERITGEERGDGRRTRVWIDGVADPLIASRSEGTILRDMGQEPAASGPDVDEALDLAARLVDAADAGRVDLHDLGRRARRLLAATTTT